MNWYKIIWTYNGSDVAHSAKMQAECENAIAEKIDRGEIKKPWSSINGFEILQVWNYGKE